MAISFIDKNRRRITGKSIVLLLTTFVAVAANILDGLTEFRQGQTIFYLNIANIVLIIIGFVLAVFSIVRTNIAFAIIIYSILINLVLSNGFLVESGIFLDEFLVSILYIGLLISLAAYVIKKQHAFVVAAIFTIVLVYFGIKTNNAFIFEKMPILLVVVWVYATIVYFILKQLDNSRTRLEDSYNELNMVKEEIEFRNNELMQNREEIISQRDNLEMKNSIIEAKNEEIYKSMEVAKYIQNAILPEEDILKNNFAGHFILYMPKIIVSGDFYWFKEKNDRVYVGVMDCTGHGVPGALFSMLGYNALNRALDEFHCVSPGQILNKTNELVISEMNKNKSCSTQLGMDAVIISINPEKSILEYAGAFNPIFVQRGNEITEIKADKYPVGLYMEDQVRSFHNQQYKLKPNDVLYLFSDGLVDQFGGANNKKFTRKRFKNLLLSINDKSMDGRKEIIVHEFEKWKLDQNQVDDILLIGLKV